MLGIFSNRLLNRSASAKVCQQRPSTAIDPNIFGFDVIVHKTGFMHPVGSLHHIVHQLFNQIVFIHLGDVGGLTQWGQNPAQCTVFSHVCDDADSSINLQRHAAQTQQVGMGSGNAQRMVQVVFNRYFAQVVLFWQFHNQLRVGAAALVQVGGAKSTASELDVGRECLALKDQDLFVVYCSKCRWQGRSQTGMQISHTGVTRQRSQGWVVLHKHLGQLDLPVIGRGQHKLAGKSTERVAGVGGFIQGLAHDCRQV